MRPTDRDRERISCVGFDLACFRKKATHHEGNLRLVGRARADDGLLDLRGGKFGNLEACARKRRHRGATRLAQQKRGSRIDVHERLFDGRFIRRVLLDHGAQLDTQFGQTVSHVGIRIRLDDAVSDPRQAWAVHGDHAPAGMAKARINAENSNHLVHSRQVSHRTNELRTRQELTRRKPRRHKVFAMALSSPILTRRAALRLGALGLGGIALAPLATAQALMQWPMRLAYARVSPAGFVQIRGDEQSYWTAMQARLGGLIEAVQPLQPHDMLGVSTVQTDPAANSVAAARQLAATAGFNHVVLYATNDGQRYYKSDGSWFQDTFASLRADIDKDDRASGEALLLDISGGMPLATVTADAKPRDPLNLFDGGRNPERETLAQLTANLERRLQDMCRLAFEAQRSIAD